MAFIELIIQFLLPIIPAFLFYRLLNKKIRAKLEGKIFGIHFEIKGNLAGALTTYIVVFILLNHSYGGYQ